MENSYISLIVNQIIVYINSYWYFLTFNVEIITPFVNNNELFVFFWFNLDVVKIFLRMHGMLFEQYLFWVRFSFQLYQIFKFLVLTKIFFGMYSAVLCLEVPIFIFKSLHFLDVLRCLETVFILLFASLDAKRSIDQILDCNPIWMS